VRYLSLAEALVIAEAVTGIDSAVLARSAGVDLLDSALHAPQAGFGDHDFYPDLIEKAFLAVRIARNHPLPDGNKRLAWGCLNMFCELTDGSWTFLPMTPWPRWWPWRRERLTRPPWSAGWAAPLQRRRGRLTVTPPDRAGFAVVQVANSPLRHKRGLRPSGLRRPLRCQRVG